MLIESNGLNTASVTVPVFLCTSVTVVTASAYAPLTILVKIGNITNNDNNILKVDNTIIAALAYKFNTTTKKIINPTIDTNIIIPMK